MGKVIAFVLWIITWLRLNAATLIGILQSIVKAGKELGTGIVNLIALFVPTFVSTSMVEKVRAFFNAIDSGLEWIKSNVLPKLA
ncbi:MAG: hypothetical protein WC551_10295 [Patescibacteria group bacterium]